MRHYNFILLIFLSSLSIGLYAQNQPVDSLKLQQIDSLLTRVIELKDIETLYQTALQNNYYFHSRLEDEEFMDSLTHVSNRYAFDNIYVALKASLYHSLTKEDVTALDKMAMFNPALVKKLIVDQSVNLHDFSYHLVSQLTGLTDSLITEKHRKLFESELDEDLQDLRNGTFMDIPVTGDTVRIVRNDSLGLQSESFNDNTFYFKVNWLSNSRFSLTDTSGQFFGPENEITLNVYRRNGDIFSYIYRSPDDHFLKGRMIRISDETRLPKDDVD